MTFLQLRLMWNKENNDPGYISDGSSGKCERDGDVQMQEAGDQAKAGVCGPEKSLKDQRPEQARQS